MNIPIADPPREQILKIISESPRRFSQIISKNPDLAAWVAAHSQVLSTNWAARIHSALTGSQDQCSRGFQRKFLNIRQGWGFCGPAKCCACNAEHTGQRVSLARNSFSSEKHQQINQRRKQTMREKYGVEFNSQRPDIHHRWSQPRLSPEVAAKLEDRHWLTEQYLIQQRSLSDIASELGVYYGTVGEYCRSQDITVRQRSQHSQEETQISNWLAQLGVDHVLGDWQVLGRRELDIWIPQHNLAIEVNGLYWHSFHPSGSQRENRRRHLEKTQQCESQGISLIHITDWEWRQQTDIVKNLLLSKLGRNQKIGARACEIQELNPDQAHTWFQQHHLQGSVRAQWVVALVQDQQPLLVASVGKSRFHKTHTWELLRLCGAPGITVVGGVSRLASYIKNRLDQQPVITYCDRSKSSAQGYQRAGFELTGVTDPGYFWTQGTQPVSRYQCQRQRLAQWLPNFNPQLSESQNMFAQNWRRYWDCGNWILSF